MTPHRSESRKRSNSRNEVLRETVLSVAAQCFSSLSVARTGLQDIADAVGISRPALYYYFKSKAEILDVLLEQLATSAEAHAATMADRPDLPAPEALRIATTHHALWLLDDKAPSRLIDRNEADIPAPVLQRYRDALGRITASLAAIIARGIAEGRFRAIEPQLSANSILGMCDWIGWSFETDEKNGHSKREVAIELGELAVRGLLRDTSQQLSEAVLTLQEDVRQLKSLITSGR